MKIIESITDVQSLPLIPSIKTELQTLLIEVFSTIEQADAFWKDEGCFLVCIEPSDTEEVLMKYDMANGHWLDFITTYPEEVRLVGNEKAYLLALAITNDSGAGGYLLIPLSHVSIYKTNIKNEINHQ